MADWNHEDLNILRVSSSMNSVVEVAISPSGDFLVVNLGRCVLCTLDAHSVQILAINMVMNEGRQSLAELFNLSYLDESIVGATDINQRLILFWQSKQGLIALIKIDYFGQYHTDVGAVIKMQARLSSTGGVLKAKFDGCLKIDDLRDNIEFRYEDHWSWKDSNPELLLDTPDNIKALRSLEPSLLLFLDTSGSFNAIWLEPALSILKMKDTDAGRSTSGNVVTTDKLVQYIKECHNADNRLATLKDPSGLTLKLDDNRQPIYFTVTKLNGKQLLMIICYNLQLLVLDYDLITTGFMEHQCYFKCKR